MSGPTAGFVLALCITLATAAAVPRPTVLLLDGGSKRATAVLSLRRAAAQLQVALGDGREVRPVSLKWVDWVPADELGGVPARLLRDELEAMAAAGERHAVVAPLFLGPSNALATGVAAAAAELDVEVRLGECLVTEQAPDDTRVGRAMADGVLRLADERGLTEPLKVVLVDHGPPSARVNAVRGRLCRELGEELGARAEMVVASSMERRAGAAYDFNEPLLEGLLESDPWRGGGDVVVALAFLSPGRHAGAGGDIEDILAAAEKAAAGEGEGEAEGVEEGGGEVAKASVVNADIPGGLHTHCTPLLACHPLVTSVLVDRVKEAEASAPLEGV